MTEFKFGEPKERFFEGCRIGVGESIESIKSNTKLNAEVTKRFDASPIIDNPNTVMLTPIATAHSIFRNESVWKRGVNHYRSFQKLINSRDGKDYSLVVKGGDLHNFEDIKGQLGRVTRKQIPGSCEVNGNLAEFNAAVTLQTLALEKLGRLTHTTMPIDIRRIEKIPNRNGDLVEPRVFMNSPEYPQVGRNDIREAWGIPKDIKMGYLLIGKYNLKPSEYLYAIDGEDIRSNEIASLLFFGLANDEIVDDPLAWMESGLFKYGVYLEYKGRGYDESIRAIYTTVANAYGVSTDFLPRQKIDKSNYIASLRDLRKQCWERGPGPTILNRFIDRVSEVAALGHSSGYTFSDFDRKIGGSLIARNVTFKGVVLDLDTFRSKSKSGWDYVTKDFGEMLLSAGCISRLVSYDKPKDLFEMVQYDYLKKFFMLSSDKQDRVDVARAVHKDKIRPEIMNCL